MKTNKNTGLQIMFIIIGIGIAIGSMIGLVEGLPRLFTKCEVCQECGKNDYLSSTTIFKNAEEFGYANGLVMPMRIWSEQKYRINQGIIREDEIQTCEEIIEEMYDWGYPVASGETTSLNLLSN